MIKQRPIFEKDHVDAVKRNGRSAVLDDGHREQFSIMLAVAARSETLPGKRVELVASGATTFKPH